MKRYALYALRSTLILVLMFDLIGCDAFVRKFTRKKKKTETDVEMVLAPEEYKPTMDKEALYRQYFMFWKAWQEELIESYLQNKPHKKRVDCANQAFKNLNNMKEMLNPEKQKKFDAYFVRMKDLRDETVSDIYGRNLDIDRMEAERLRKDFMQYFSYPHVKNDIVR